MDKVTRYGAMAAFCRQRAKMVGENEHFWLTEADSWEKLLSNESIDTLQKKTVVRRAGGRKVSDPPQSPPA